MSQDAIDSFSSKMVDHHPEIDRDSFALIVVDMVNDFLEPDGVMPVSNPGSVIEANRQLVEACRNSGGLIIWVRPGHTELLDGLFRKRTPHGIGESHGAQVHSSYDINPNDKVIRKRKYSAFFGTDLDSYLREHQIKSVLVSGVALNICVRSTVHDAFFNGYEVFVVDDACQATSARERESTLYDISTHFGTVLNVQDVIEAVNTK